MKITVLDGLTVNPGDLSWDSLSAFGELTVYPDTPPELVAERAGESEVVLVNKTPIGEAELSRLPKLRYIGVFATGYNVIDTAAAARHNVCVTNVPGYSTDSVAQHTFALLFGLCAPVSRLDEKVRRGIWWQKEELPEIYGCLTSLAGLTMGIVGSGSIGRRVGRIAESLGMRVLYTRKHPDESSVPLETLLRESDVVSLHCPQTPETEKLICRETLAMMKDGAFLVNTARGGLVDEEAAAEALRSGKLAGYGADVVSVEPILPDNPLLTAPNCLLTPHVAWVPQKIRQHLVDMVADNLRAFLAGEEQNRVN